MIKRTNDRLEIVLSDGRKEREFILRDGWEDSFLKQVKMFFGTSEDVHIKRVQVPNNLYDSYLPALVELKSVEELVDFVARTKILKHDSLFEYAEYLLYDNSAKGLELILNGIAEQPFGNDLLKELKYANETIYNLNIKTILSFEKLYDSIDVRKSETVQDAKESTNWRLAQVLFETHQSLELAQEQIQKSISGLKKYKRLKGEQIDD